MPIKLVCPKCSVRLTLGDDRAGTSFDCPKCSTAINVPVIEAPNTPVPRPAPVVIDYAPEPPAPIHEENADREEHDSSDEDLSRRDHRRRRARRRAIFLVSACLVLGVAAVLSVAFALDRWQQVQRAKEEQSRTAVSPTNPAPAEPEPKPGRTPPNPPKNQPAPPTKPDPTTTPPAPATVTDPKPPAPTPAQPPVVDLPGNEKPTGPSVGEPAPPAPAPAPAPAPTPKPYKSDRPAKEVLSGYYLRTPSKFKLYVSRLAYENSDEAEGEPLKVIDDELARVAELFPEANLKALRTVPIWVEWDHVIPKEVRAFACYYLDGTAERLAVEGVDPRKAGCVCVLSLKVAHDLRTQKGNRQNVLLHELAHAVHDKALKRDNATIKNAYEQAIARKLYTKVKHDDGKEREAYANTNAAEYFAELTCAYLDRLDYYPHDAKELKEHDSVGYELMTKVYGTPEQITAAKKKEADKKKDTDKK